MENVSTEFPTTPEEESRIIKELSQKADFQLREGNTYYVLSTRWYLNWQHYTGQPAVGFSPFDDQANSSSTPAERPGPIDNSDILSGNGDVDDDPQLLRTLLEGRDYVLLPEEAWGRLYAWYGGGPVIARKLVTVGDAKHKQFSVEIYPLCLCLIDSRDESESFLRLSKKASLRELYDVVCRLKGVVEPEKVRIVDYFNKQKHSVLVASDRTLEDSELQMDQHILLEVQNNGFCSSGNSTDSTGNCMAIVLMEPAMSSFTIAGGPALSNGDSCGLSSSNIYQGLSLSSSREDMEDEYDSTKQGSRGLAGLQNLGNTCFMNSTLQCLVHTQSIFEYFLQDFADEINQENPLGMNGELAIVFGQLLRRLWSSGREPVAPRGFKRKLSRFAPQFEGYNQHDSQELLAFLLDGLHEDLNRVKKKPYIEAKDYDGRPDAEVADELWRYHKARNDSIIVDFFQGQYKSTLVCPVCKHISYTFDPFMYLSLPLPSTATRAMTVTVFHGDGSGIPAPYTVTVLKDASCKDLIEALATACHLKADEYLLLAEVFFHKIYRYFEDPSEVLASVKDDDHLVAYRLPKWASRLTKLAIAHRRQERFFSSFNSWAVERKLFLTPLVTYLEDPVSASHFDLAVSRVLAPLVREEFSSATDNGNDPMKCDSSQLESGTKSTENTEPKPEPMFGIKSSFRLFLTDNRWFAIQPISSKDTPLKVGRFVNVFLDWKEKANEVYDVNYIKDIPEVHKKEENTSVEKAKPETISLFSCLDAFLEEEPLGPDDMWYCTRCKEHTQATKKLDLWRLPDVLVIHLKRFSYSRWMKNKLDTFVDFPIHNLDLSNYVNGKESADEGSHEYELYAISNHYGGLGGGHYTAYCKLTDNRWYHFDDSRVSPVKEEDIKTSAAYVLFYRKVGTGDTSNVTVGEYDNDVIMAD